MIKNNSNKLMSDKNLTKASYGKNNTILELKREKINHYVIYFLKKHDKFEFFVNNKKNNIKKGNSKIINFFMIIFFLLILPKEVFVSEEHYIEIRVNKKGENKILSDEYKGILPLKVFIDGEKNLYMSKTRKVYIGSDSINETIKLQFSEPLSNFSFMFSNLSNINYINIYQMFSKESNLSYMFYNCINLENFTYTTYYENNSIIDLRGMFYNCSSLESFYFHDLYIDYYIFSNFSNNESYYEEYYHYDINMSYMFYNCQKLDLIMFDTNDIKYVNDMKGIFYNCYSLKEINLSRILTNDYIDYSYSFYNCKQLAFFDYNRLDVKDVQLMFYNCYSLYQIDLNYFNSTSDYLNMSSLFYNCSNLTNIYGTFQQFNISDMRDMFYNCSSLEFIDFFPFNISSQINMTKMFFNCNKIQNITFRIYCNLNNNSNNSDYYYFYPNDLHAGFYNCTSLISLYFNNFITDYVQDISYMFFNCIKLSDISLQNSSFNNELTTNMRGAFQNCESLTSFDLSFFYTPKAEIMWDMFKGCNGLEYLNLENFDTSKVTDMESMFEGCSNLINISLISFDTSKVHYMNKMFKNCIKLETINFKFISSQSLGTTNQMFYNCQNLKYLNIYNLAENFFTIEEMFEGVSKYFSYCIKNHEEIPNIFRLIYNMDNTTMDCSEKCHGYNKFRIQERKICCLKYEYNGTCYNKCPGKTRIEDDEIQCKEFNCSYYYNYEQNDCLNNDTIPDGYYVNDSIYKTIDKCNETCKTCGAKNKCLTCVEEYPFLFFGKCFNICEHGFYTDSGIKKCKCEVKECAECTEESVELGLCSSCADDYYPKADEIIFKDGFRKCYKDPANYYLDKENNIYEKCYYSCESCYGKGNDEYHNCITCDTNYSIVIPRNSSGYESLNCFKNCSFYHYYEDFKYICTETDKCPSNYSFLIPDLRECVKSCNESDGYFRQFRGECLKQCPPEESKESDDNPFLCKVICTYDKPFEKVDEQICVTNCSIMERKDKLCITNYEGNRTFEQMQNLVQNNILDDLIKRFNFSLITDNETVIIQENDTIYEIISSKNKNKNSNSSSLNFGNCEKTLKDYYKIGKDETLYILKIDAKIEGKTGPSIVYKIFYPLLDPNKLEPLDLTLCEGDEINVSYHMKLENSYLYDKESPYYHDICFPYSSNGKVDLNLEDRIQNYSENNMSLCEENCQYIGYDAINEEVLCKCEIKIELPLISDIKIDKNKLYKFVNFKKSSNFAVLKCIDLLFSKRGLKINIGFYFFTTIIISYFICIYIFYKNEYNIIENFVKDLSKAKQILKIIRKKKKKNKKSKRLSKGNKEKNKPKEEIFLNFLNKKKMLDYFNGNSKNLRNKKKEIIMKNIKQKTSHLKLKNNTIVEEVSQENVDSENGDDCTEKQEDIKNIENQNNNDIVCIKLKETNAPPNKKKLDKSMPPKPNKKNISLNENNLIKNDEKITESFNKEGKLTNQIKRRIKEIMGYNDKELNELSFKKALKYDERTYTQYYISLLKTKHLFFKIFNKKDYNSRIIKVFLCIFNFALSLTANALFFTDETMHKILLDEGEFNFIYQLPQTIYSAIISIVFTQILNTLGLSEKQILNFKKEKYSKLSLIKEQSLLRVIYCNFIIFFVMSFLFLIIFWYYISCFCAVYKNTQYHLIKDTFISFASSMFTPLIINIFPGIFRRLALKKKKRFIFGFSKLLQLF